LYPAAFRRDQAKSLTRCSLDAHDDSIAAGRPCVASHQLVLEERQLPGAAATGVHNEEVRRKAVVLPERDARSVDEAFTGVDGIRKEVRS